MSTDPETGIGIEIETGIEADPVDPDPETATGHAAERGGGQDPVIDAQDQETDRDLEKEIGIGGQDLVIETGRGVGADHETETERGARGASHTLQPKSNLSPILQSLKNHCLQNPRMRRRRVLTLIPPK